MITKEKESIIKKIAAKVKLMEWSEIREHGINFQVAIALRNGQIPAMRKKTIERLKMELKIA